MLNRVWRIVLIVIALITIIWPDLLGTSTWWISLVAMVLLLLHEILHEPHHTIMSAPARSGHSARRRR